MSRTHCQTDGIKFLHYVSSRNGFPDFNIGFENNSFFFELSQPAVDYVFIQFEIRNAVTQQSADAVVFFKNSNGVSFAVELLSGSQSCWTGTNHSHFFTRSGFGRSSLDHPFYESHFGNSCFVFTNGYRCLTQIEYARFFARCRTNSSGKIREIIGFMQHFNGFFPSSLVNQILPFRHFVAERACPVTKRNAAIHAARCLQFAVFLIKCLLHFSEIINSFENRAISRFFARNRYKCFWISHIKPL